MSSSRLYDRPEIISWFGKKFEASRNYVLFIIGFRV